ncbi:DNA glycosylase [Hyaloscypha variabilis F]|uniref:DNA glycosylase n=1 Tax=Hyaloscypha variabilis (strain UAMH 11265 / GT02V1 / F) TaxID=1149755 RepID=A0A2J6RR53_HYAVF|nr:DNA glycosylase [Hyaloscypha variabilis F]
MARKNSSARKPKARRSENVELDSAPKHSPTPPPTVNDDVKQKLSLTTKGNKSKSDNSMPTKEHVDSTTSDLLPSSSARRQSKRKRAAEKSTLESLHDTPLAKKPHRPSKGYAPPSTYAHLKGLVDTITPNLLCLFVGLNPGIQTATLGHPYAHPSNHFWRLLHSSGLTPDRQLAPAEYVILPKEYDLGNTNIVDRATRNGGELSKDEMVAGAGVLDEKIRKAQPEVVCLVGKSIWEAVWKWKYGKAMKANEFKYGFQDTTENMGRSGAFGGTETPWQGARVFVATSTSGLAASLSMQEKQDIWAQLGQWVGKRREERKGVKG